MKKAMFHKFSNLIQQAVDTFSPNVTPQEEFVYHWKSVTSYFVDNKDGSVRIEETALPEHLSSMLRIIQEEESDLGEAGTTGMCLEYLLQHRLLETLYTLGRTDHPPGMKQIVLSFFTKLLSRISHPLLPHINVHRAVQRMVKACGETKACPTEKEEIEFLCTVCAKIKSDPYLVNFFIESPKATSDKGIPRNPQRQPQPFSLVNALLALSHSEDARVSVKACEGLMLCASLPEQSAASTLINQTQFCQLIAATLGQQYERLPPLVCPDDIEGVEAKWGFDDILERNERQSFAGKRQMISFLSWLDYCDQLISVANPEVGEALALEIHRQLLTFQMLPHLMQTSESGAIVATTYMTRCLRTVCSPALLKEFCYFLLGKDRGVELKSSTVHPLKKRLLERCNHLSEEVCIATLRLLDTLLQKEDEHIFHSLLLCNLLGRNYLQDSTASSPTEEHKTILLPGQPTVGSDKAQTRATQESASESKTLPDLDAAGKTDSKDTASDGTYQESRSNTEESETGKAELNDSSQSPKNETSEADKNNQSIEPLAVDSSETFDKDIAKEPSQEKNLCSNGKKDEISNISMSVSQSEKPCSSSAVPPVPTSASTSSPTVSSSSSSGPCFPSPNFGRSEVHKVVNCFLSLLPEEAKSSYQTADGGYDMYLRDAHKQFSIQETVCKEWAWPKRPVSLADYRMDLFYEGSFLHMLLEKLLHLLDQSYSVNLLLTALISKVALIPHPNLHEFLLDPFLPIVDGTRILYSVLVKVTNEIKHHQKADPTFSQKLLLARKQLLGMVPTIHSLVSCLSLQKLYKQHSKRFEDQSRMEAVIVLEEFCKELSAITFVKHHAAVTRF